MAKFLIQLLHGAVAAALVVAVSFTISTTAHAFQLTVGDNLANGVEFKVYSEDQNGHQNYLLGTTAAGATLNINGFDKNFTLLLRGSDDNNAEVIVKNGAVSCAHQHWYRDCFVAKLAENKAYVEIDG